MKKQMIVIPILVALIVTLPVSATGDYSEMLVVDAIATWDVVEAPDVPFSLFWSGSGKWLAESGSKMQFTISSVDDDIEGTLTLGNHTWMGNDTDIANDLVLGVFGLTPFLPGLFIETSNDSLEDLTTQAMASAFRTFGNYLNGTMESGIEDVTVSSGSYRCIAFDYTQDESGWGEPQRTTLAYDLSSGILVFANTTYSFGVPYSLVLEYSGIIVPPSPLVWASLILIVGVVVIVGILVVKRR
ncbi:MAG: hypothetical protein ACFFF4_13555 [Candidatus Thorarchaeota archaeon]